MNSETQQTQKRGGCFWIMVAYPVIGGLYILYVLLQPPNLEVKKFRNDCVDQQVRSRGAVWFSDLGEQSQYDIIRYCEAALKRFLDSRR